MEEKHQQNTIDMLKNKKGETYNEEEMIKFFESRGLSDIQVSDSFEYRRFSMKENFIFKGKEAFGYRTAFIGLDKNNTINKVKWVSHKVDSINQYHSNNGCGLLILIGIIGIVATLGYFLVTGIMDGISNFEDDEEFNPYTEDYDGDGLGGDADDHDILHQMDTLPTE